MREEEPAYRFVCVKEREAKQIGAVTRFVTSGLPFHKKFSLLMEG